MATQQTAAKYSGNGTAGLKKIEDGLDAINNALSPFGNLDPTAGMLPSLSTGARALVRCGGKAIGLCQSISWNISVAVEPIITLDSVLPWDVDMGVVRINATLGQFIDPTGSLEAEGMFSIVSRIQHAPFVEMQVLDASGTSIFFARGVFNGMSGSIQRNGLSNWTTNFTGVTYQHYVQQDAGPVYSTAGAAAGLLNSALGALSGLSGGIL